MAEFRICSIEGCSNRHAGRGYCNKHLKRLRAHGDPLVFLKKKSPNGAPAAFLKQHLSETHAADECVIWPFNRNDQGYPQINIRAAKQYVHRIVCEHHYGPAPKDRQKTLHSCGNGHLGCINEHHLRWGTMVENQADSRAHGTLTIGAAVNTAKLDDQKVGIILSLIGSRSFASLSREFGVAPQTISDIAHGRSWAHVSRGSIA